jgi:hypothetical protein
MEREFSVSERVIDHLKSSFSEFPAVSSPTTSSAPQPQIIHRQRCH